MGWFSKIATGGVVDAAKGITKAITDYKGKKIDAAAAMAMLENEMPRLQNEINLSESKHPSLFVSGWRPAVGWVCAFGLGYSFLVAPILNGMLTYFGTDIFPRVDMDQLIALLVSMLGLTGFRSSEKWKGVARS